MKKPVLFITIADDNNLKYARASENSFKKFHSDIPFHIVMGKELKEYVSKDNMFFYRATPILGEKYLDEYELVVKIDADSIICGDLSYIWNTKDYDIGTVINWNRVDPQKYGFVQGWGIAPVEYMNCGLVAMRNPKFAHEWKNLCFTPQFDRLQYKEQDLLNVMIYFGNWNCRCFDHGDGPAKMNAWWGLIVKGELGRAVVKEEEIIIPKGLGETPFPPVDMTVKIIHFGGGNIANKTNYKIMVNEDVSKRLDYLIGDTK